MFSPQKVVQMLHTEYGHEKTHAYQILRDSYALWGDAYDLDKHGVAKMLVEAAHVALQHRRPGKGCGHLILKAIKQLGELHKLNQVDNTIPPELAMPSGTRVYVINGDVHMPRQPAIPEGRWKMSKAKKYLRRSSCDQAAPQCGSGAVSVHGHGQQADFVGRDGYGYQTGFRATFNGGRGCGKTNTLMRAICESAFQLPRAKMGLASLTFRHVQDVVLSQSRKVFDEYGLHEYEPKLRPWGHYVINRRPPEGWWHPWRGREHV